MTKNQILLQLKKYEQALKIKSDLQEAFEQVAALKKSKAPKQTLTEFLQFTYVSH
jgi:NADH dehydrogenase FAD-containing subunit